MRHLLAALAALAAILIGPEARAERRVALVIGNAAYAHTTKLLNPSNDAADMAEALRRLGFDVLDGRDLDKRAMERLIRQYSIKLAGADVALFFYAGHGLQLEGQNYLLPTDAKLGSEGDVDFESLSVNLVIKQMEREAKTSLVLLDACRDNPLTRNLSRNVASTRSAQIGQGLAEVKAGIGTLIGFSTQPGAFALDGPGRNSPYTEALLKHVETPGKDFSGVLVEVRNDVLKSTNGRQVPWEHTSLTGQVYLKGQPVLAAAEPAPSPGASAAPVSAPPNPSAYDKELEILFWNSVKDSKSPAVLEAYLERYPDGTFNVLARVLINNLRSATAKAPEPPKTTGSTAWPAKPSEPVKVATLPAPDIKPQPQAAPDPQVLTRAVQVELKRVGCDPGAVDGKWGGQAKEALTDFARRAKTPLQTEAPTTAALDALVSRKDRVCPLDCDSGEKEVNGKCVAQAKPAKKTRAARTRDRDDDPPPRRSRAAPERSSDGPPLGGITIGIGRRGGGIGIGF